MHARVGGFGRRQFVAGSIGLLGAAKAASSQQGAYRDISLEESGGKRYLPLDSQFLFLTCLFLLKVGCRHRVLHWSVADFTIALLSLPFAIGTSIPL